MPFQPPARLFLPVLLLSSALAAPVLQKRQDTTSVCPAACQKAIIGIISCLKTSTSRDEVISCTCGDPVVLGSLGTCSGSCQDYMAPLTNGTALSGNFGDVASGCTGLGYTTTAAVEPLTALSADGSHVPVWLAAGQEVHGSVFTAQSVGGISTEMSAEAVVTGTDALGLVTLVTLEEYIAAGPSEDILKGYQNDGNNFVVDCLRVDEAVGDCVLVQALDSVTTTTHFTFLGAESLIAVVTAAPDPAGSGTVPSDATPTPAPTGPVSAR